MKFGEWRKENVGWNTKIFANVIKGKNLTKEEYVGADFDEDETYKIDDCEVSVDYFSHGMNKCRITLTK